MSESSNTGQPLPQTWELPIAIRQRIGREAGAQRAVFEEGHLLLILHFPPGEDPRRREAAFFWRNVSGEWRTTAGRVSGAAAIHTFLNGWETRLQELEEQENQAATAAEYHRLLSMLAPVLRASRGLHRAMQQARELVPGDRDIINFRDKAAALERAAELLTQDSESGLNYVIARRAEEQAESGHRMASAAHRLNILAALFLPLTAISGVYGMNLTGDEFNAAVLAGVVTGIVSAFIIARRRLR